ncbi:hypothetical protein ACP179_23215 [Xenorhabdus stockiae]|uniref:hypothetical protein n=1 Tax=Xenorhabdus stockiae TaxID=351614 RepID=UPI003CF2E875
MKKIQTDSFEGEANVILKFVYAKLQDGTSFPPCNAECFKKLSSFGSKFIGLNVKTKYNINTKTGIMLVSSEFIPSGHFRPLVVKLSPLGISGIGYYEFIGKMEPDITLFFLLDKDLKNPVSTFLIPNNGKEYNCVISSSSLDHDRIRRLAYRMR